MRWAMEECDRLGLSFGTHNCPGWSSSAYGNVTPEYSMQKLVYSEVRLSGIERKGIALPRPEVNPKYNYYEDIAVLAMPDGDTVSKSDIINVTEWMAPNGTLNIPQSMAGTMKSHPVILRFGHTTNGKTNEAQAPATGQGLECDKMRREAVRHFWDGYPQMLLDIAGELAGRSFTRIEIDSYEAGGQDWSVVLPEEFSKRKGYDIVPYLPHIAGRAVIDSKEKSAQFMKDLADVVTSLFAENYYGYMSELASQTPGLQLMIEPYGTGHQRPFRVVDIYKHLGHALCTHADMVEGWWRACAVQLHGALPVTPATRCAHQEPAESKPSLHELPTYRRRQRHHLLVQPDSRHRDRHATPCRTGWQQGDGTMGPVCRHDEHPAANGQCRDNH